jgi:hypothetical protein
MDSPTLIQCSGNTNFVRVTFDFQDDSGSIATLQSNFGGNLWELPLDAKGQVQGSLSGMIPFHAETLGAIPCTINVLTKAGVRSNLLDFTIDVVPGARPYLTSAQPVAVEAGGPDFTLTVNGVRFTAISSVVWNGTMIPTTVISDQQLKAVIPAVAIAKAGLAEVEVWNLNKQSCSQPLQVQVGSYHATLGTVPTQDIIWDAVHQTVYGSIPAIGVFDPSTGGLLRSVPAGANPGRLALSDDARYLYVGLSSNAIQRFQLPAMVADLTIPVSNKPTPDGLEIYPGDFKVAPGAPGTLAVAMPEELQIYDNGSLRGTWPNLSLASSYPSTLAWGRDASRLYAGNFYTSSKELYVFAVGAQGPNLVATFPSAFAAWADQLYSGVAASLLYSSSGEALDPETGVLAGTFPVLNPSEPYDRFALALDATHHTAYFLIEAYFGALSIKACDLDHYTALETQPIPGYSTPLKYPTRILRTPGGLVLGGGGLPLCVVAGPFIRSN